MHLIHLLYAVASTALHSEQKKKRIIFLWEVFILIIKLMKYTPDKENGICELCKQKDSHDTTCKLNGLCMRCGYNVGAGYNHSIYCSLSTKEDVIKFVEKSNSERILNSTRNAEWMKRRREEVTMWQGKFRIVKHENNKLRKQIQIKHQYQLCPKCNGDGHLGRYNSPNLGTSCNPMCDVCFGKKIISTF